MKRSIQIFAVSALAAGIAACGGSSDGGTSTGSVSVGLTDAPIDNADAVNIEVEALVLQSPEGDRLRYEFDFPQPLNLLELQGGAVEALIQDEEVPAGEYSWMRLEVGTNNTIEIDGAVYDLTTPSARGVQTSGFVVPAGGEVALTIDFDVRKSIVNPQNDTTYKLKPVVRLVDNSTVGTISGTVTAELINEQCTDVTTVEESFIGNIYVHEEFDQAPDDIGSANEPLVVVPVTNNGSESTYTAAFIPTGDYTVSYSCGDDFVETTDGQPADDDLTFVGMQNVEVVEGETATANFDTQVVQQ
ncbi:uncharacterized protein DUF4382 [Marinobacter pelagius]|uniref:Uncharacterized protein DUF4382 n=1 Tax=Marinobacter pelagius TaxID=379482 RepID=A0A366GHH4_9GAMM|nr:DUF4382 domain-containing protein [Marinobacter pelagius]RBP26436.1 uncharacterized protein DUF4382 [Marinobacter pelagius]